MQIVDIYIYTIYNIHKEFRYSYMNNSDTKIEKHILSTKDTVSYWISYYAITYTL